MVIRSKYPENKLIWLWKKHHCRDLKPLGWPSPCIGTKKHCAGCFHVCTCWLPVCLNHVFAFPPSAGRALVPGRYGANYLLLRRNSDLLCRYQKIHWRSVPGSTSIGIDVANRGEIRFARRAGGCNVRLVFTYEVPQLLVPFAGALNPIVENRLRQDMECFRDFALKNSQRIQNAA